MWSLYNFKYIKTMKNFNLFKSLLIMLCMVLMGGGSVMAETKTYRHVFNAKPSIGNGVKLTGVIWDITATNLNGYNSGNYAGVQIGAGGKNPKNGSITLRSSSAWNFDGCSKITQVRLWLNLGGTSVTPSVTIGGKAATSDGTVVTKNANAGTDWTKATRVTFTPASSGNSGIVEIKVETVLAGYICAMEIDCEEVASSVSLPILSLEEGIYWSNQTLTITVPSDATGVKYTIDGSDPKTSGTAMNTTSYTQIELSSTTTIRAIAYSSSSDGEYSNEVQRKYTFAELLNKTEAKSKIDGNETLDKVCVTGVVTKVDSYNPDKTITYWIDDDFEIYKGKGIGDSDFSSINGIKPGATVVVYGALEKYGDTYELNSGNYLVSYTDIDATLSGLTIDDSATGSATGSATKTNYSLWECFDKSGLVAYAEYSNGKKYDVTNNADWTITPSGPLTCEDNKVSVSVKYSGASSTTKEIGITVSSPALIDLQKDLTTTSSTDKLEWELGKITITADKDDSGTKANNYFPGAGKSSTRFYTDSKLTFTPSSTVRIDEIIFTATSEGYASALKESTWTNAKASASSTTVTITPVNGMLPVSAAIGGTVGGTQFVIRYTDLTAVNSRSTLTGGYGTVCLNKAAKVVGAKIYNVQTKDNNTIIIKEVADNVLEAGKPYIYKATDGSQTFYCASSDAEKAAGTNGVLVGSYSEADIEKDNGNYILHGDKFYLVNSDNVKVGANRAYIHIDGGTSARMMIVDGNTETGICLPEVDAEDNDGSANVYDLSGRRVANVKSGVYVQNGKLFIK